jgi:hypothetical protein
MAAGFAWYAFARTRRLDRWKCFLTALVPTAVVRAALPSEYVFPIPGVFSRIRLEQPLSLFGEWSALGILPIAAGVAVGCVLALGLERFRSPPDPPALARDRSVDDGVWLLSALLCAVAALDYAAYQRFLLDWVDLSCARTRCVPGWFPIHAAAEPWPRLELFARWRDQMHRIWPFWLLSAAACTVVVGGVLYVVVGSSTRWRSRIASLVGVVGSAALVGACIWLHSVRRGLLMSPTAGWELLGSAALALLAVACVGCLLCAFFAFIFEHGTLHRAAPWLVGFMGFAVVLRFALENGISTDRLYERQDVDLLLVRLMHEQVLVASAGLSLCVALWPGRPAREWVSLGPSALVRLGVLLFGVACIVVTRPLADDSRVFLDPAERPFDHVSIVDRCRTRLPDPNPIHVVGEDDLERWGHSLDWFTDAPEGALQVANLLISSRLLTNVAPPLGLAAPLDTRVGRLRGVLRGAALAHRDVLVLGQRVEAVETRTVAPPIRRIELCGYGTVHISSDETAMALDSDWTLATLIDKSSERPVNPSPKEER